MEDSFVATDHYHLLIYKKNAKDIKDFNLQDSKTAFKNIKFFDKNYNEIILENKRVLDYTGFLDISYENFNIFDFDEDLSYFNKLTGKDKIYDYYISDKIIILFQKIQKNIKFKKIYLPKNDGLCFLIADDYLFVFTIARKELLGDD